MRANVGFAANMFKQKSLGYDSISGFQPCNLLSQCVFDVHLSTVGPSSNLIGGVGYLLIGGVLWRDGAPSMLALWWFMVVGLSDIT